MSAADWAISSRTWTSASVTIAGSVESVDASAGGLYLYHPTDALSLVDQFLAAMTSAGVTSPACYITEAGYVRITGGANFTVTWTNTTLRDLLGFSQGDLSGAAAYTAASRSTLLWRPGKPLSPMRAPLGAHGQYVADLSVTQGPQGVQTVREEGDETVVNEFIAKHVPKERYWNSTPTLAAGDFGHFWRNELKGNHQWYLLRGVIEGASTTTAADVSAATTLGPFVADMTDPDMRRLQFVRATGFELVEAYYNVRIPAIQCEEFTA